MPSCDCRGKLRRGRDHEVRRRAVAGRRHFVQAVEDVEEVDEEVEALEPAAERQLVADRQVGGERARPADAERHGAALRRRAPSGSGKVRSSMPRIGRSLLSRSPLTSRPTVSLIGAPLMALTHRGEGERPPRVPAAAGRQHVGAVGPELAVVGADVVVEPHASRVGVADADVVAALQGVGEAAAPPVGHAPAPATPAATCSRRRRARWSATAARAGSSRRAPRPE